jgi:hypothetical protein
VTSCHKVLPGPSHSRYVGTGITSLLKWANQVTLTLTLTLITILAHTIFYIAIQEAYRENFKSVEVSIGKQVLSKETCLEIPTLTNQLKMSNTRARGIPCFSALLTQDCLGNSDYNYSCCSMYFGMNRHKEVEE